MTDPNHEHSLNYEEVITQINSAYNLNLEICPSTAPTMQIIGAIDGRYYFYFTARGNWWHCEIAKDADQEGNYIFKRSEISGIPSNITEASRSNYAGSWLDSAELERLLRQCLDDWKTEMHQS